MMRNFACLAVVLCVSASARAAEQPARSTAARQTSNGPKQAQPAAKQAGGAKQPAAAARPSGDEAAVRQAIDSYVDAFNRGDAKALAGHFAEQGSYVDPATGERLVGREAIGKLFESLFAGDAKPKISVSVDSLRLLDERIAVEEGTAAVTAPGAPRETSTYLAIHVKKEGKWSLDSVRETVLGDEAADEVNPLEDLAWMVGRWVDKSEQATVETVCEWTANKAFLMRSFTVAIKDLPVMSGTQIIAWDASTERIRSWVFDSDGTFGEGVWTRHKDRWSIKAQNTLADGKKGTAVQVITKLDDNSFTWESIARQIDGELLPNVEPITIVRAPAGS